MPKIFVLRHQLAEQQAKLRQHDKGENSSSPPLSSDEDKFEPPKPESAQNKAHQVSDILQRPPPGLVIQPIPPPSIPSAASASTVASTSNGKQKF